MYSDNSGNLALKLDMSKAYYRVEWRFVLAMTLKMGFLEIWIGKIWNCITTLSFSALALFVHFLHRGPLGSHSSC